MCVGDVDWVAMKRDTKPRGDARGRRVPSEERGQQTRPVFWKAGLDTGSQGGFGGGASMYLWQATVHLSKWVLGH